MFQTQTKSILLLGLLSMFFAEVLIGSSKMWFLNPILILLTYPLYLLHSIFLVNVGFRNDRLSLKNLYALGMIFGLYESWITKVLWSGYPADTREPIAGLVGGVAVFEFAVLVFFYHPLFAFIVPVLTYERLMLQQSATVSLFQHPRRRILTSLLYWFSILFLMFMGAFSYSTDLIGFLVNFLGTILLIYLNLRWCMRDQVQHDPYYGLRVGNRGFLLLSGLMAFLYLVTGYNLEPQYLPKEPLPYLIILFFYVVFVIAYLKSDPSWEEPEETFSLNQIRKAVLIIFIGIAVFLFVPAISFPIIVILNGLVSVLAPIAFLLYLVSIFR